MLSRVLVVSVLAIAAAGFAGAAFGAQTGELPVVVLDVQKPADQRLLDWMTSTLTETEAHLFVLQIDSPGISSGDPSELYAAVLSIDTPVVAWVGADPAAARGGMASLLNLSDRSAAAPGVEIGMLTPTVVSELGAAPTRQERGGAHNLAALADGSVTVTEPIAGLVDEVIPTVGQLIVGLDGRVLIRPDGTVSSIETARTETLEDGTEVIVPSRLVEFRKPGLFDRFLRLAAEPEAAFFFLVAGIAVATFEFYAAGVGVTAAVAVLSLFLAGYGMATLPMNWLGVGATVCGLVFYTWDFQRNRLGWRSFVGTALLVAGGLNFTAASPQFASVWWIVLAVVVGAALFYGLALTTIARSRFSTRTIGRDHLIGRMGVAATDFGPDGIVDVDGARWRGRSHREADIRAGDPVAVTAVAGIVLEVEPAARD